MKKISLLFVTALFLLLPGITEAATTDNLSGYAWSSTIGWVSFNCTNTSTCGTSNYGVNVSSTGALSGHAWSSNAGWISFNSSDLSGCPSGTCSATFNKVTGDVTGWARAISGSGPSTLTGNWGGWISLAGASPAYGVAVADCEWSGYAWGSGPNASSGVVGWLSFMGSGYGVLGVGNACSTEFGPPAATFTATPTAIVTGGSSTLTWNTSQTNSCFIDNGVGSVALSGTRSVSPSSTTTYKLTCSVLRPDGSPDTTGASLTRTVDVTVTATALPELTAGVITPTNATAGTAVSLSSVIANNGSASTATTFTNVFQTATDASGTGATVIGTVVNQVRAAGTSGAVILSYTFPTAGTKYVRACADNNALFVGTIAESNEGDNCGAWTSVTVTGPAQPDLTAGAITPTTATAGTAVTLSSIISNNGNAHTGASFTDNFQKATDAAGTGATSIGTFVSGIPNGFPAGYSEPNAQISYTFPSAGTFYVRACADNNASMVGTITESNEANNCGAWTEVIVASTPTPGPNVVTGDIAPTTVTLGIATSLSATVTNIGDQQTGNLFSRFTDVFQIATSATGAGATVIGTASNPRLSAGDSSAVSLTYTFPTAGTVYVRACADNNASFVGTVSESNESDNCGAWTAVNVTSSATPNLTAGTVTPTTATVGTAVTLSSTVSNTGTASTGTTFTDVFQVADDALGTRATVIGTVANATRLAGSSGAVSLAYTFTTAGTKYVRACADNNASFVGTIAESNEGDNCGAWTAVTAVNPTGAVVASCSASPSSVSLGTPVLWTATASGGNGTYTYAWGGSESLTGTAASVGKVYSTIGAKTAAVTVTSAGVPLTVLCSNSVTVTAIPQPNLTADIDAPVSAIRDATVTLSATVRNTGNQSTGAAFWTLFQTATSAAGAGATDIGSKAVASLVAGASSSVTLDYAFPTTGTLYVRACADKSAAANAGGITESNEGDNCSAWREINVYVVTGGNLTTGAVSPASATAGTPVTMTAPVTNNGLVSTGAGFTNLFQFDNDVDHTTITSSLTDASPALGSGLTDTSAVTMNFPSAGTWYVRVCADNNTSFVGNISETDEGDNCSDWTSVSVASAVAGANLTAGDPTPVTAVAGTATTISSIISNTGAGSTVYTFNNLFQFDNDSNHNTITSTQTDTSPAVTVGGSDTSSVSQTFPSTGTWYVRVCADNNTSFVGVVTESNEGDNCSAWTSVTVTATAGPNLITGSVTPVTATAGTAVSLRALVTNAGSASTAASFVNVFQTATDANGTGASVIGTYTSPARAAGATINTLLSYTFATADTYYVRVCADNNASFVGTIVESNEGDNCGAWTAVSVGGTGNDVDLRAGLVTPLVATVGLAVTFNSTMTNAGTVSTGAGFTNLFQFDNDVDHVTNGVTSAQTDAVSALAPSGTEVSTVTQTFPSAGTWYVRTCVDNDGSFAGTITETNEGNNCSAWRGVTVSAPTGAGVTSCTVDPTSVASGGSVTWTAMPAGLGVYTWAPTEGGAPGGTGDTLVRSYTGTNATFGMTVTAGGSTVNCPNISVGASPFGPAVPVISVSPARVVSGSTSVVTVSATGVDTSCTVTGPGISQTILASGGTIPTTNITTPVLTTQSTYTISCDNVEAVAKGIINVIPGVQEF